MDPRFDVELVGVTKRYGAGAPAVDDISLRIPKASYCCLLGPSGCGKTSTLRMIAGHEAITSGDVLIHGQNVTGLPPVKRGTAMMFQSYALFPHLNVAENIVFGLRARGVAKAERTKRLAQAASLLGLERLLDRKPSQLSGGQQQRVALGRAVVAEARVCLMDEPLSNLDAQLRAEMRREILALQRRLGMTMLYVTHDQTEAMAMADRVVLLQQGRIAQSASPAELYARPASHFVAGFIGTPPMNVLPARLLTPVPPPGAVTAGIRPESIRLDPTGPAVTVESTEYLGADTNVTLDLGGARLLARLPGQVSLPPGARTGIGFDAGDLHFFDENCRRLQPQKEIA